MDNLQSYHLNHLFLLLFISISFCHHHIVCTAHISQVVDASTEQAAGHPPIYIVYVRKPDHMLSASPEQLEEWHKSFLPTPTLDSGKPRMVYSYKEAISGFAARLLPEEVEAMKHNPDILDASPDEPLDFETTHTPDFLGLRTAVGTTPVWRAANRGDGVIVGVVDTGINRHHQSFAGAWPHAAPPTWNGRCNFYNRTVCNSKILGAKDGAMGAPDDGNGHGTHVAGIVSGLQVPGASINGHAAGEAAGPAPSSYLAVYKATGTAGALWCIDEAIKDGVGVLSISMSQVKNPFHLNGIAIGALSAVRNGILVNCAAGNYGPRASTVRNEAPWITTVGASTIGRALRTFVRLGNRTQDLPGESVFASGAAANVSATAVYPGANGGSNNLEYCKSLTGVRVMGKIVLCRIGGGEPADIAKRVKNNGGVGMVLMNLGTIDSIITNIPDAAIPTVAVNYADSVVLTDYVAPAAPPPGWTPWIEFVPDQTIFTQQPFPAVPYFSSRGPSLVNGGILKPDILAPGVNILSASHTNNQSFVLKSGTSMATPHISGISAILKASNPNWTPAMIRSAIMTTAEATNRQGNRITDETGSRANLYTVGAGHVNPAGALRPGLVYDVGFGDYVRYLCGLGLSDREVMRVASINYGCWAVAGGPLDSDQLNYPSISVEISSAVGTTKVIHRNVTDLLGGVVWTHVAEVNHPMGGVVSVTVQPPTLNFANTNDTMGFDVTFTVILALPGTYEGQLKWRTKSHPQAVVSPLLVIVK